MKFDEGIFVDFLVEIFGKIILEEIREVTQSHTGNFGKKNCKHEHEFLKFLKHFMQACSEAFLKK